MRSQIWERTLSYVGYIAEELTPRNHRLSLFLSTVCKEKIDQCLMPVSAVMPLKYAKIKSICFLPALIISLMPCYGSRFYSTCNKNLGKDVRILIATDAGGKGINL